MHPVIRVVCFLLFSIALARPDNEQLAFATLLIIGLLFLLSRQELKQAFFMVRRLRWLLLSVFLIYGWFTPGTPVELPLPDYLLPAMTGLEQGALRILSLILILLAVGVLLAKTSRSHLIASIYGLLAPLKHLRWQPERFAVRLALTLDYVEQQESLWRQPVADAHPKVASSRIQRIAQHLGALLPRLFQEAEQPVTSRVSIDVLPAPRLIEWLWPVLLLGGFLLGAYFDI